MLLAVFYQSVCYIEYTGRLQSGAKGCSFLDALYILVDHLKYFNNFFIVVWLEKFMRENAALL